MNLEAYLARIGYRGPRVPTLAVLRDVVCAHARSIPFENLDVLLGRGISLDDEAVERKLVHDRRGGYCFEQNSLLLRALTALGFSAAPLSARVRVNQPPGVIPPRTHLFLRVELDGVPWLADVGIGGLSPTGPFRLDAIGIDVCEFTLEEMPAIDRELSNWWTSTHPQSRFRQNLIAGLARPDGTRVSILNREFTHRRGAEVLERFEFADADHLLMVLAERFGLVFPAGTRFGTGEKLWPTN
jgi:N-hydroxyarylamine O-acetyltransferase